MRPACENEMQRQQCKNGHEKQGREDANPHPVIDEELIENDQPAKANEKGIEPPVIPESSEVDEPVGHEARREYDDNYPKNDGSREQPAHDEIG